MLLRPQPAHQIREHPVRIQRLLSLPADDQRRARLVDQNVVHLIDNRVAQRPLHLLRLHQHHVVAQIVEAELIVRPIRDVRPVRLAPRTGPQHPQVAQLAAASPLLRVQLRIVVPVLVQMLRIRVKQERRAVLQHAHRKPQRVVDRPHPLRVALGQVVVDRDQMRPIALQRVQIQRQRRHQRLALARPHLRHLALVQHQPAEHLHVVVAHLHLAPRRLAHHRERLRQDVIERGAIFEPLNELRRLLAQRHIVEPLGLRLPLVDRLHYRFEPLDLPRVRIPEQPPNLARHPAQQRHPANPLKRTNSHSAYRENGQRSEHCRSEAIRRPACVRLAASGRHPHAREQFSANPRPPASAAQPAASG